MTEVMLPKFKIESRYAEDAAADARAGVGVLARADFSAFPRARLRAERGAAQDYVDVNEKAPRRPGHHADGGRAAPPKKNVEFKADRPSLRHSRPAHEDDSSMGRVVDPRG